MSGDHRVHDPAGGYNVLRAGLGPLICGTNVLKLYRRALTSAATACGARELGEVP
jgi:hypothetical protein